MGQKSSRRTSINTEKAYFEQKRREMLQHFTKVAGFIDVSSEWVVIFREEMKKYNSCVWSRPVFKIIDTWESYHDSSSKVAFVWNEYNTLRAVPRIDHTRACLWQQSISNLQTFCYEIEISPQKKALNSFLTEKHDCTLFKIIKTFKRSLVYTHCCHANNRISLNDEPYHNLTTFTEEIDGIVLDFIRIILKILPKFFLSFPTNIPDIEEIVRNAVVSDDLLDFLVLIRKEYYKEIQEEYLRGLENFSVMDIKNGIYEKLQGDKDENYFKAMRNLLEMTQCRSIGQISDNVAMLMNHLSMGLFDEEDPGRIMDDSILFQAFLFTVGKSSAPDLPVYMSILNKFLDNSTLSVKGVGQGIVKLTYIINNSREWTSFISN